MAGRRATTPNFFRANGRSLVVGAIFLLLLAQFLAGKRAE